MGVWANPPIEQCIFDFRYHTPLIYADNFIGAMQAKLGLMAEVVRIEGTPIMGYRLMSPNDLGLEVVASIDRFTVIEHKYTDWRDFKAKVMHYAANFIPLNSGAALHGFIGLACVDLLKVEPYGDGPLPLSDYIAWDMGGPSEFKGNELQTLEWVADYRRPGKGHLLRVRIDSDRHGTTDIEGVESIRVVVDRRIVGIDDTPISDFLDMAHEETKQAFHSLLNPRYRERLQNGG